MIYLDKNYLTSHAFERFIDESSQDNAAILDNAEMENIMLIKTYIGSRYDVMAIFDEVEPIPNELLKRLLAKMMLYDIVRRNAARKVPTDYKEDYERALKTLKDIAQGKLPLDGLPIAVNADGKPISHTMWGNNTNENYYI